MERRGENIPLQQLYWRFEPFGQTAALARCLQTSDERKYVAQIFPDLLITRTGSPGPAAAMFFVGKEYCL